MSPRASNPLRFAVLAMLDLRPMHPYEIAAEMRARALHEHIKLNYGSLYSVVDALTRDGLIAPHATTRAGRRPERTVYALTGSGRSEFQCSLRALLRKPVKEYTHFAAGLSFLGRLSPDEATALLDERARRLDDGIEETRTLCRLVLERPGMRRISLVELEHELMLRTAELEWVRRLVREIEHGELAFPDAGRGTCAEPDQTVPACSANARGSPE